MCDENVVYHEIDFLLLAQRFNIQFSYMSQKGLPFVREFVLRLIHLAPMTKNQISAYFGFSRHETDEAVSDLVQRGELTLSANGRLTLTEKSMGYFSELGQLPQLSVVQDSAATLSFDLATFSCVNNPARQANWGWGISIDVDSNNLSQSESLVEKHFQSQFNQVLDKGFLRNIQAQQGKERPSVYTVNAVDRLGQFPLRLTTGFKMNIDGESVEWSDYDELISSDIVHELIAGELDRASTGSNMIDIFKSMTALGDGESLKLFDSNRKVLRPDYLEEIKKHEEYQDSKRKTFLGPVYLESNWHLLEKTLVSPLSHINEGKDQSTRNLFWVAPSNPFWAKTNRFTSCLDRLIKGATSENTKRYNPILYLPVSDASDSRTAHDWKRDLDRNHKIAKGLIEGFLGGNVEILYLEDKVAVVVYHLSQPETLPVTVPFGFITTEKEQVKLIGRTLTEYVHGTASFDNPNDCGSISILAGRSR